MRLASFAVAVALLVAALGIGTRRGRAPVGRADATPGGILLPSHDRPVAWDTVQSVTILTRHRRIPPRTEFAVVVDTEEGSAGLSSRDGSAQRFLAECHHLPAFPHAEVVTLLSEPRSQRSTCYRRPVA